MMQHSQSIEQSAKIHAAQVRARLFNQPKPKPIARIEVAKPISIHVEKPADLPAPQRGTYPYWKYGCTRFNQHMVDYREWQRQSEEDWEANPFSHRSMLEITAEVLESFPGVTLADLKGDRKSRAIVMPRQIAIFRIKYERPELSFPVIGRFFGGRDHTTCLHAVKKIEKMVEEGLL